MYIGLFLGHSILKSGEITSANGIINEYHTNKELIQSVSKWLNKAGIKNDVIIVPEKSLTSKSGEKDYKIPKANSGKYDLVCELHLNCYNGSAIGAEVLYSSTKGKEVAQRVQNKLKLHWKDRGVKQRTDLYMLNSTKPVAIMLESFFVDSKNDVDIYKKLGADELGRLIAEGLANKSIPRDTTTDKPSTSKKGVYRVVVGSYSDKNNAIGMQKQLETKGFPSFLVYEEV